jgi:hypothetical protein
LPGIVLSEWRPLRSILLSRIVSQVPQAAFLLATASLIILGWGADPPDGVDGKFFAKSNFVTLTVWGIWWPTMILAAVVFGRVWCSVCPMQLLSRMGEWFGSRIGVPQRSIPSWTRAGWLILLLYASTQLLISALHVHRVPNFTAYYLLSMLVLAGLTGMLFRNRAYCRAVCPVGLLLKVYGRGGILAVRACDDAGPPDPRLARHCRSGLDPARLAVRGGEDCLLCQDCIKADAERGRMQLQLRLPWTSTDQRPWHANAPVTLFVMMLSGFVAYEITGFWTEIHRAYLFLPDLAVRQSGIHAGVVKGLWVLGVFPLLLWALTAAVAMAASGGRTMWSWWKKMAYPVSLLVAALHMTKAIEKLSTWSLYLPGAIEDPLGAATALGIANGLRSVPTALLSMPVVIFVGVLVLAVGIGLAVRESRMPGLRTRSLRTRENKDLADPGLTFRRLLR